MCGSLKLEVIICFFLCFLVVGNVSEAQVGQLKLTGDFVNCDNEMDFFLTVTNETPAGVYQSFKIKWGDGSLPEDFKKETLSHTYKTKGRFDLTFIGVKANGAQDQTTYSVVNDIIEPRLGLTAGGQGGLCVGDEIRFVISELQSNTSLITYHLDFGDGQSKDFTGEDYPGQAKVEFTHRYSRSSCELAGGGAAQGLTITITATNACGKSFTQTAGPYEITAPLKLTFNLPAKECTGNAVNLDGVTSPDFTDCMKLDYRWFLINADGTETRIQSPYTFDSKGVYKIKATGKRNSSECSQDEIVKTITILQRVKAIVMPVSGEVCEGESLELDASASEGEEKQYKWWVIDGDASAVKFLPDARSEKVKAQFKKYGRYVIRMEVDNGCSYDLQDIVVQVKKDPEIVQFSSILPQCPGTTLGMANYISYDWTWSGNPKIPAWTIEGPAGGWQYAMGDQKSPYPYIKFILPGDYTLNVRLKSVGCGGTKLSATQTVRIYDPEIHADIVPDQTDICEGETITFTDHSTAVNLHTYWEVLKDGVNSGIVPVVSGDKVRAIFPDYGKYKVTAYLTAACDSKEQSFNVVVRRAPEIRFVAPFASVCPGDKFYPGAVLNFLANGNESVTVEWQITGPGEAVIEGKNTWNPKVEFSQWGEYEVTVKLVNPTHCGPTDKLIATQKVTVNNPEQSVNIQPDRTTICAGELVTMQNHSVIGVEPVYQWSVTPLVGVVFDPVFNAQHKAPKIRFNEAGAYRIMGLVQGVCKPETVVHTIIVQKDPEISLDAIPGICPGTLKLTDQWVHYQWNDDWQENAESQRKVDWTLISKPAGAVHTPSESPEWNELYPTLELKTPGIYTLQATLRSSANCGGTLVATQTVEVFSPDLNIDVHPQLSADVISLGHNTYQVVEARLMHFINQSTGVGLHCHWSCDRMAGVVISDAEAFEPDITFGKHGTYKVRVDLLGTCRTEYREFEVVVKGIPKFNFATIPDLCDTSDEIDLRNFLVCDSAGSTEIICNWNINPELGYEITEGTASDLFFKIHFLQHGIYTLTLQAKAEYGGVQTLRTQVKVLNSAIVPKADFISREGCSDDGFVLKAKNRSEGDSLKYTWNILPAVGWEGRTDRPDLDVKMLQRGNYTINLKAENICGSAQLDFPVRVYSKPEVEVLGDLDLGRVCERSFQFTGEEHIGDIQENNDALTLVKWTITPQGAVPVNGTSVNDLRPDFIFAGGKNYILKGQYKNHCEDTVSVSFTLGVDKYEELTLMRDTAVCALSESFTLRAEPLGGIWQASENDLVHKGENNRYYFTPNRDETREVRVIYELGSGTCLSRDTAVVLIHKLPVVNAGADLSVCLNWEAQELEAVRPEDGTWRGPGVDGVFFNPQDAGVGDHHLEYWYTDDRTRCTNRDSIVAQVHELPDPAFRTSLKHCQGTDSLFIPLQNAGNHYSWDFGDGNTGESDGPVAHQYAYSGYYDVAVRCVSAFGCENHFGPLWVDVLDLPPLAVFDVDTNRGCGPLDIIVSVNTEPYLKEHLDLKYAWVFGNGGTSELLQPDPAKITFQPRLSDTTYDIRFEVFNVCGRRDTVEHILVHSSPVAHFYTNPEEEGCDPMEVTFMNTSTGSGNQYSWTFGDGTTSLEPNPPAHIYRTDSRAKEYYLRLEARNLCNVSEMLDTIKVKPNSLMVRFTKDKKYICAGNIICFNNFSTDTVASILNQFWDFGDGQRSTDWDVCHQFDSVGTLPVKVTVGNGCTQASFTDTVVVYPIPRLSVSPVRADCEDETFEINLNSDQALKTVLWEMGDGTQEQGLNIRHVYEEPGHYQAVVSVALAEIPSCEAKDSVSVEVWSKPRVKILPLDTMDCPSLLYRPEIVATSYDYFRWDYGDGTGLTSEMEHIYENETDQILSFPVTAYVENNRGCKEEHRGMIRVYNGPHAAWDKEITYGRPEKVRFINLSRNYTECFWYLPNGQVLNTPDDQVLTFEEEDIYPLSLAVKNEYGCRDSLYMDYRSYMGGLYFPNTFIPHSSNPKVNRFNGIGVGLKEYRLEIFDLYGNKVWETSELVMGAPGEGWDGRNKKGKPLPQGMYIWRAKAIFFSEDVWTGNNNRSGNAQTTEGTVLLLRE